MQNLGIIVFALKLDEINVTGFDFHIEDPNQHFFFKRSFDLMGASIIYNEASKNILKAYKIQTNVNKNLGNDPKANCFIYGKEYLSYAECRKNEEHTYLEPLLGCVPPFAKKKEDDFGNETCTGSREDAYKYLTALSYSG